MKFFIKEFFSKCVPQETMDLVTFTEEIHNAKLHFLCSVKQSQEHLKSNETRKKLFIIREMFSYYKYNLLVSLDF